jgi:ABC-type lipoprotein export system ATPase subunit
MIKLTNLDKYFNKGASNEIHVINDISLELPDKGLVVLLGPSGSGKTTLLNVLGGLDKVKSGTIEFGDQIIKKYNSKTWDKIRNQKVGYIFQNYNLLTNLTVYDNISLTLNMIGIYEKEEIDRRIDYILERIGMINYRKRKASQLSGGQQQRVAIARALAKNPQVIIADEPTGNLDSKNTQEVMDIIKRISLTKLVILVTHEENIANFYGDRIIRLRDGQIVSDKQNKSNGSIDVKHETDIYLGDLTKVTSLQENNNSFTLYTDEDVEDQINVRLIVKNKTVYVDVESKEYKKMQLLESDSEITIYDRKYEDLKPSDDFEGKEFDLDSVIKVKNDYTKHSVFSLKDSVKLALTKMKETKLFGKLFYVGFVVLAALIALAVGMLNGIFTHTPKEFLEEPKELVDVVKYDNTYDDFYNYTKEDSINYIYLVDSISLELRLPSVFQSWKNEETFSNKVSYSEFMDESKLIAGSVVKEPNQIVIDKVLADKYIKDTNYQQLGITSYQDLFNLDLIYEYDSQNGKALYKMEIVGIIDDDSPVMYVQKNTVFFLKTGVGILENYQDDITISNNQNLSDKLLVYTYDGELPNSSLGTNIGEAGNPIYLEGTFTSEEAVPKRLISSEDMEEFLYNEIYTSSARTVRLHASDVSKAMKYLLTQTPNDDDVVSSFEVSKLEYASRRIPQALSTIIFALVVLGASSIMYLLVIRSNLLSRIYEISVYRGLGVTKNDIRKMFVTEIVIISSLTSLIGYLAMTFILYRIQLIAEDYMDVIYINPLSIIAGIVVIYLVNIISGLIPVSNLIRKTPAEIFSKYDF